MDLPDFARSVPLDGWNHSEKIRFFAWFLHTQRGLERFGPPDIGGCYDELQLERPTSISPFLSSMARRKPRQVLHDRKGYYLERSVRQGFGAKWGKRSITVEVTNLLTSLPAQVPDVQEREFLHEALVCYRNSAFRAAIVMTWNLAFDHLLSFILKHRLSDFNAQWPVTLPRHHQKARLSVVSSRDGFAEFKESEILQICKSAAIITPDTYKILDEKLGKRNTAAHPSTVRIGQLQAESFIDDLINNVVLKMSI